MTSLLFERNETGVFVKPLGIVACLYLLTTLWTCWFTVDKTEQAVTIVFGKHFGTYTSGGPYFNAPWPFGRVLKVDVQTLEEIPIGYHIEDGKEVDDRLESETLTSDSKTVMIDSTLQFSRTDATSWLFVLRDPELTIGLLGKSALRSVTVARTFDQILTTERTSAQADAEGFLRDSFERLNLNASLVALQVQDTQPPQQVRKAFDAVVSATEEKGRMINEATGYKNAQIAKAEGEAKRILEEAEGYRSSVVNNAQGQTERFNLVYEEYRKAPELTRKRMQFEALETALTGKAQVIDITAKGGMPPLKLFDVLGAIAPKAKEKESVK